MKPAYTDVEFEVICDPRPVARAPWSFWFDDAPNLIGGLCALGLYVLLRHWF